MLLSSRAAAHFARSTLDAEETALNCRTILEEFMYAKDDNELN
jgi:hypothetical protein